MAEDILPRAYTETSAVFQTAAQQHPWLVNTTNAQHHKPLKLSQTVCCLPFLVSLTFPPPPLEANSSKQGMQVTSCERRMKQASINMAEHPGLTRQKLKTCPLNEKRSQYLTTLVSNPTVYSLGLTFSVCCGKKSETFFMCFGIIYIYIYIYICYHEYYGLMR